MVTAFGTNGGEEKSSQDLEGKRPLLSSRRWVVGCCDHCTKPSSCIKCREFLK